MLPRLLQVCWFVLLSDIRSMAFDDSSTINLKTKNNGKIDPLIGFDVFPTSRDDSFAKTDKKMFETEVGDPDMDIFFKDVDFFKDDDSLYKSSFGDDTMNDFFSRSLEESRNRYKEDVDNIDKMFETPVKSIIDKLLRGETTQVDTSSRNLNNSERETERNGSYRTKQDTLTPKTNSSKSKIPVANSVNSENFLKPNGSLSFDINRTTRNNVVAKLESKTDRDNKDVVDGVKDKDENRKIRGSDIKEGLVDLQDSSFRDSMTVVTEISVQETVNGRTVERKPNSEELRHIKTKLPATKKNYETNNRSSNQEEDNTAQDTLPNDVIDDLASFLKVDPNFADDGEDKMLMDDEEVKDMDVILSDNDESMIKNSDKRNIEVIKNLPGNDDIQNGQEINVNTVEPNEKDQEGNSSSSTEDPRNYRKIFHTEHKNSSNVSDVKIMFSETEGDFLDEDDDSEYSTNNTEKPEKEEENRTIKNINVLNSSSKQLTAVEKNSTEPELTPEIELPNTHNNYTDLPGRDNENVDHSLDEHNDYLDSPELTTILDQVGFVTESPQPTEISTINHYNEERSTYSDSEQEKYTEVPQQTTGNIFVTENIPIRTEKVAIRNNIDEESTLAAAISTTPEYYSTTNYLVEEKVVLSSQNINDTMNPEIDEELEEPIPKSTDESFLSATEFGIEEMGLDEIDRTMALIKQILAESGDIEEIKIDEQSQKEEDVTKGTKENEERKETASIPLDTSTVPIDSTSYMEDFTEQTNYINNMELTTDNFFTSETNPTFISTTEPISNTEKYVNVNNAIYTNTFTPIADITELNIIATVVPVLGEASIKIVTTDAPRDVVFKEEGIERHEMSPNEVESIYNSQIEEYESLEDASDDSNENVDGWTIFKNKEHETKINKENYQKEKNGLEISKLKPNISYVSVGGDTANGYVPIEKEPNIPLVAVLRGIVLNNTAEFSIKITKEDEIFYVPSSAYIREYANTINITWETNEYLNNSIALKILEAKNVYIIKDIMVNLLTGNEFKKQKKSVNLTPSLDDTTSEQSKVVKMKDGTDILFSNVEFLKKNYVSLEYSEASMRERRLWHIEIAFICLAVIAILGIVFYVVAVKTKKKITLKEKNELAQVTHC